MLVVFGTKQTVTIQSRHVAGVPAPLALPPLLALHSVTVTGIT